MKTILLTLSTASLLLGTSCRIYVPVDPNTGVQSCKMMPDKAPDCKCPPCACTCKTKVQSSK